MKKQILAAFALAVMFTSCQDASQGNKESADTTTAAAKMQASAEMETPTGPAVPLEPSRFIPNPEAQAMIDAYAGNKLPIETTYFLVNAQQVKDYITQAEPKGLKDMQLLFARHSDGQITLVISAVKPDGSHIPYLDPNNANTPSALEHVYPCPPGNCNSSTNLNQ